jgi:iron complex transport system substrate-binding protein
MPKKRIIKSMHYIAMTMALVVLVAMFAMSFTACKSANTTESTQAETTESAVETAEETTAAEIETAIEEEIEEITITDGLGNEVTLAAAAEKIIVFVPSALEIFHALGAMDKVIGVDNWSIDMGDPLAEGLEGFGDFQGLNMEKVTAADPDLIIGLIGWAEEDINKLEELGIQLYIVDANTVDEVYTEILNMGKIAGMEQESKILMEGLKAEIDDIRSKTESISAEDKPKVFYEVWNDPLMSAGNNTFINELIEYAGGKNIVAEDGLEGWPEYSLESLIQNNPDIIIAPASLAADPGVILSDGRLSEINAVKNERVYVVPDNPISRPSQNVVIGLLMFAQAIHPDIFGDFVAQ